MTVISVYWFIKIYLLLLLAFGLYIWKGDTENEIRSLCFELLPSDLTRTLENTDTNGNCLDLMIIHLDWILLIIVQFWSQTIKSTFTSLWFFVAIRVSSLECSSNCGSLDNSYKTYTLLLNLVLTPGLFYFGTWVQQLTSDTAFKLKWILTGVYWKIHQAVVHTGVGWRIYPKRDQFLEIKISQLLDVGEYNFPNLLEPNLASPKISWPFVNDQK